ncbi:MAG: hypothetical protein V4616_14835 [Bacteroidota bacterium]
MPSSEGSDFMFIVGTGTSLGKPFVTRAAVKVGTGGVINMALMGGTETCTSNGNCQECAFATTGGCKCVRAGGSGWSGDPAPACNHSVSRLPALNIEPVQLAPLLDLTVLPNPTTGLLLINVGLDYTQVSEITVTRQSTAQAVFTKSAGFLPSESVNLSNQPADFYVVRVVYNGSGVISKTVQLIK